MLNLLSLSQDSELWQIYDFINNVRCLAFDWKSGGLLEAGVVVPLDRVQGQE